MRVPPFIQSHPLPPPPTMLPARPAGGRRIIPRKARQRYSLTRLGRPLEPMGSKMGGFGSGIRVKGPGSRVMPKMPVDADADVRKTRGMPKMPKMPFFLGFPDPRWEPGPPGDSGSKGLESE